MAKQAYCLLLRLLRDLQKSSVDPQQKSQARRLTVVSLEEALILAGILVQNPGSRDGHSICRVYISNPALCDLKRTIA